MRVAIVRSDISKVYLDDVENTSQRCFSSEPVGQSRYFHMPTDAELIAIETKYGITQGVLPVAVLKNAVYVGVTAVAGQTGVAGVVSAADGVKATLTGLTGMTAADVGKCITISLAVPAGNNGTFRITDFVSASSVKVANADAVVAVGLVTWTEYVTLSVNVSTATIQALAGIVGLAAGPKAAITLELQNLIAPSLVETGPVLLSFVYGKLGKLSSAAFIPGAPQVATQLRVGLPVGHAAAIVANDGVTPFTI